MTALSFQDGRSAYRRTGPRRISTWKVIATADFVVRPILIAGAIVIAATVWSTPSAHSDPVDSSYTSVLSSIGIGNNGPLSTAIAQVAQSLCPLLVQPGSSLASNAIQASGNGGLAPTIGGAVAGLVIQSQCPNAMTQLANGNFGPLMQLLAMANASPTNVGQPGAALAPLTAAAPALSNPLQLAGLS